MTNTETTDIHCHISSPPYQAHTHLEAKDRTRLNKARDFQKSVTRTWLSILRVYVAFGRTY